MILKNPDNGETIRVRRGTQTAAFYLKERNWIDVTPAPTPKQLVMQHKFIACGQLTFTAKSINDCLYHRKLEWSSADKSILQQAERILKDKYKRIKAA